VTGSATGTRPGRRGPARWIDDYRGFLPDARRFLLVTLVGGAATSLWWIDFNLYLVSLGIAASGIGIIATVGSVASALAAIPASSLSDRIGRRIVMAAGTGAGIVAALGLAASADRLAIALLVALFSAGSAAVQVVASPYMTEHSRPEHRSELFALQFAIGSATNVVAAALGGVVAGALAGAIGAQAGSPDAYRLILVFMALLLAPALIVILRLTDDRPALRSSRAVRAAGEPARFPRSRIASGWTMARLGMTVRDRRAFARLLIPSFLISIGAGQVIPFLNVFVQAKFGLDIVALNGVFAITSLGTMVAILFQPTLARRFGRIRSVIIVQGASLPFLLVLGFSPILWTVIAAMAVRNSLMNAGNPIFNAFAMDQVSDAERATLAAFMSLEWSVGWVIAGAYYSTVHAVVTDFDAAYAVNFVTIIVLYSVATLLYWRWFGGNERRPALAAAAGATD
jgi:MFS family permease